MKIDVNVREILDNTPKYLVGKEIVNYASVPIACFDMDGRCYTVNGLFDLDTEVKIPVIADEYEIIINKIKGL